MLLQVMDKCDSGPLVPRDCRFNVRDNGLVLTGDFLDVLSRYQAEEFRWSVDGNTIRCGVPEWLVTRWRELELLDLQACVCEPGYFFGNGEVSRVGEGIIIPCLPCPPGTSSNSFGTGNCIPCEEDFYNDEEGQEYA